MMITTQIAQKLTRLTELSYDKVVGRLKLVLEELDASFYFTHPAVIQDGQLLQSVEGHLCYGEEKELVSEFFYEPGSLTPNEARLEVLQSMFLLTVEAPHKNWQGPSGESDYEPSTAATELSQDEAVVASDHSVTEAIHSMNDDESVSLFEEDQAEVVEVKSEEESIHKNEAPSEDLRSIAKAGDDVTEDKTEVSKSETKVEATEEVPTVSEQDAWEPVRVRGLTAAREQGASASLLFEWETLPAKEAVQAIKAWIISKGNSNVASA